MLMPIMGMVATAAMEGTEDMAMGMVVNADLRKLLRKLMQTQMLTTVMVDMEDTDTAGTEDTGTDAKGDQLSHTMAMADMEDMEDMGMEDMGMVVKQYASTSISASSFTRLIVLLSTCHKQLNNDDFALDFKI